MAIFSINKCALWFSVAAGTLFLAADSLFAQDQVATAPAFEPPQLSNSLLDFLTGMPVAKTMKEMGTDPLLREPFAGAKVNTPKGLAAKIRAKQVDAPNRVEAVEFLGTVDCVTYPESQQLLVKTMQDDPSEEVRLASVKALQQQLKRGPKDDAEEEEQRRYDYCRGCCNEKVLNALSSRAYDTDETGCYIEPSKRVREAAKEAIRECVKYCPPARQPMVPQPEDGEEAEETNGGSEEPSTPPPAPEQGMSQSPVQSRINQIVRQFYQLDGRAPPQKYMAAAEAQRRHQRTHHPEESGQIMADASQTKGASKAAGSEAKTAGKPASASSAKKPAVIAAGKEDVKPAAANQPPVLKCLQGYCVVALKENRLVEAQEQFASVYNGHTYHFSSAEAKKAFDANPKRFAPVKSGIDLVHLKRTGEAQQGGYIAEHDGRFYFFLTKDNRRTFQQNPAKFLLD